MRRAPGPDPWPDVAAAGRFLDRLAGSALDREPAPEDPDLDAARLAAWLDDHDLSSIAFANVRDDPVLTAALRETALAAAAGTLSHADNLERIEHGFAAAGLPLVLLKGANLYLNFRDEMIVLARPAAIDASTAQPDSPQVTAAS